jgi:hypothetical protein
MTSRIGSDRAQRTAALGTVPRMDKSRILTLETETLQIAYERSGPSGGSPVVLLHGFPYDVRAYDEVAPPLQLERKRP